MRNLRVLWPRIRRIWIMAGLMATAVFVAWSLVAYRADSEARNAARSDATVRVEVDEGVWSFVPIALLSDAPTLVFFPGALVDPRAYAPLARAVAQSGHRVLLIELPRRGALGGADSSALDARIRRAMASIEGTVVLAGHSRGAVVAVREAGASDPRVVGLVLIGTTHPRDQDLSSLNLPVTKIVGTRDGLASPTEVRANEALLPSQTHWVWIEGGNHSQFGWYGFQPMDRFARIDEKEQRRIMIETLLEVVDGR